LPEHTTDFIFAVIAEELGFLGDIVSAYTQAKTNLSNDNPLSHSDLQN
jgi:hypothetical protein